MVFSIISCPPNYLWQTWLEAAFPGYTEHATPQEKEKLMDEKVLGRSTSTATDAASLRSRSENEKQPIPSSDSSPNPPKAKKQLSIRNTAIKFLLDQSFGAVANTVMFILGIAMLRGQSWQYGWEEVKTGFWPLVFAGQKLWPLVSIISLTRVPVEQRMVFGSIIGVGWSVFLTLMAGGKHKTE
jgi:protein Mpv17